MYRFMGGGNTVFVFEIFGNIRAASVLNFMMWKSYNEWL